MKIALINENSQAAKNALIEATLRKVVEPMGHEVVNYGMYAADDAAQLTYVQNGILAAVLLVLCFIWGNSLLPGTESGKISGGLLAWLKETFPFLKGLTGHLIRKLGHFSEFTALGFFLSWLLRMENQQGIHRVTFPMFLGLAAANVDETIQVFRPGRGPSVIDVWIDFGGVCTGIALFFLLHWLYINLKLKGKST